MKYPALVLIFLFASVLAFAQTEGARISGRVTDPTDAVIAGAECKITNLETNVSTTTFTNEDGIYVIPDLRPAIYRLTIQKEGFRTVVQPSLQLYVQDAVNENFKLALGSVSETYTVSGAEPVLQTVSAAVSTVVNDQFVRNMPLNGRTFQSLIALVPGITFTPADPGQISVNGQRTDANYFMIDGISANIGVLTGAFLGSTSAGSVPGWTIQGGTNGLVSVDAMQEFRIQTSSYAAELGVAPAGRFRSSPSPARTSGMAMPLIICATMSSMLAIGLTRYRPLSRRSARMISAEPSGDPSGRIRRSSFFPMKAYVCCSPRRRPVISSFRRHASRVPRLAQCPRFAFRPCGSRS